MIETETLELLEWPRLCQHLATFASTKLGAIAARHLPIPPTQAESQYLLDQTQEVYNLETRLKTCLSFEGIEDIGESLERAQRRGTLSGMALFAIATTLAGVRQLRRVIDSQPDCPGLTTLVADLRTYPELEQEIYHCIDERGEVTDRASSKLAGIREQQRQGRERVYELLQRLLQRQANAIQESLITQRAERFVIPVKATHRDLVPGIVHDTSMSGATLYVEPHATVNVNNQLRQLRQQEAAESEAIRSTLTAKVAAVQPDLEALLAIATALDLATARARYSLWLAANPPRFVTDDDLTSPLLTLRQLRHPLLHWQQLNEQSHPVVPIDVIIQPQLRVIAMTGPNTGGKTVTLKTLGLGVLMAKVGLFVPAREPVEVPWFDQVLADIGDEQSLEQSLSTFSGHIRRIVRILAALTPASLVLLDEVGAGTDPTEGSALATALLYHLASQARLTVATTHFGELKALKYQDTRFENASVEFDDLTLSPTYRLLWGIPGRSNALAIARRLGLAAEIIDQAQAHLGGGSETINQVIAGLESQRRQQEHKAQAASQLLSQTEQLHQELTERAARLQARERELKMAQEQAVHAAIAQARQEIAQVIRQLQKGTATAQDAQQATAALQAIGDRHLPPQQQQPPPPPDFRPHVGDRVRIPRLGQVAEVLRMEGNDELTVRFGFMKMTLPLADIESLDGQKPRLPQPSWMSATSVRPPHGKAEPTPPDPRVR
ncbi:endonuclease MutS2 [Neosynechococcus sphagnicola]|uniref:endonuclease MutS2 n=1 Tax=Neosynechococcus sphagnicola TaxID=1501145 RepID=UPI001EF9E571|nr:endonuclease MutS2 [Neosynechococcus sphagnicola]